MANPSAPTPRARFPLGPRNYLLLGAAVVSLAAGYGVLLAGHASPAAVLLVLGYCVLFPIGIVL
jgi:hypothetical protein